MFTLRKSVSFVILAMVLATLGAVPPESPTKVAKNPAKSEFNLPPEIIPGNGPAVARLVQNVFWNNAVSGTFQDGSNWVGGLPPGISDTAVFGQNGSASAFTVAFSADAASDELRVVDQSPVFDLNGHAYDIAGLVVVGASSSGELTITDGLFTAGTLGVGVEIGANGAITINSATVEVQNLAVSGGNPVATGQLTITGPGSTLTETAPGDSAIGGGGDGNHGTLVVSNGGSCTLNGNTWIARGNVTGELTVTGSGSTFRVASGSFAVGGEGSSVGANNATVLVSNGGSLLSGNAVIGDFGPDTGFVTVTDPGSMWTMPNDLVVANSGQGTLMINNGGAVSSVTSTVGRVAGAIGEVVITDPGSTWTVPGVLVVGNQGSGTLSIENGGTVDKLGPAFGEVHVGETVGGTGILNIDGVNSRLLADDIVYIGLDGGHGELKITNGGLLNTTYMPVLANGPGSVAHVLVDGAGSTLSNDDQMVIGSAGGSADLTVSNGGRVVNLNMTGFASLIGDLGSTGAVLITGFGSEWSGASGLGMGNGILEVSDGGLVAAQYIAVGNGSRIRGDGTLRTINEVANSGIIEPGSSSGILSIDGDFNNGSTGSLAIELGGLMLGTQYDRLSVTGNADLHGTLDLSLINGFLPTAGDSFDILTYASQTGRFDTIIGSSPAPALRWALDYNPTALTLIACDPVADPSCDDCNLNGIIDGDDIASGTSLDANLDGVPDECVTTTGGGGTNNWSDGGNWPLGGLEFPDNNPANPNGVANLDVTINGTSIFLDTSIEVDALRLLNAATLAITQVGSGDLTIAGTGNLLTEGAIRVANDRAVTVGGKLTVGAAGRYEAAFGSGGFGCPGGTVCASLTAASVEVDPGDCNVFSFGGNVTLTEDMTLTLAGGLKLIGSPLPTCPGPAGSVADSLGITPPPKWNIRNLASVLLGGSVSMSGAVDTTVDSSRALVLAGDFDNGARFPSLFHWSSALVRLAGTLPQRFEVAGLDLGRSLDGFSTDQDTLFDTSPHTNFSVGALVVAAGSDVRFVSQRTNTAGAGPCVEAMYVGTLELETGATVILDNVRVYYDALVGDPGSVQTVGCGALRRVCEAAPASAEPIMNAAGAMVFSAKIRFLSFSGGEAGLSQAVRVKFVSLPGAFSVFDDTVAWVALPQSASELPGKGLSDPVGADPSFMTARLSAVPVYADWSTFGVVHVYDERIIPSRKTGANPLEPAVYEIQLVTDGCEVSSETSFSPALSITNSRWGDVASLQAGEFRAPDGSVDVTSDVLAVLAKFSNAAGAPIKARAEMVGTGAGGPQAAVTGKIDISDVLAVLGAFSGGAYPFPPPP